LTSLFGPDGRASQAGLSATLRDHGLGNWKPEVAEKLLRIVHIGAFLTGLLAASGQRLFWMSDHDAICANSVQHQYALKLFAQILPLYTASDCHFAEFTGAAPFSERHLGTLDLLSITDLAAGAIEHYLTRSDATDLINFEVKDGAQHVLQWLAHDGIGLKKTAIIFRAAADGGLTHATLEIGLLEPPTDVKIINVRV
jgi:hypothetical protein